jgi:hypothetical protein
MRLRTKSGLPTEFTEQCIVFKWCAVMECRYSALKYIYSTLNGVRLTIRQAVNAKRSGNKKGVPDICLPMNNGEHGGLYIELKNIKGGRLSPEQKEYLAFLTENNYKAVSCNGASEAIKVIEEYVKRRI